MTNLYPRPGEAIRTVGVGDRLVVAGERTRRAAAMAARRAEKAAKDNDPDRQQRLAAQAMRHHRDRLAGALDFATGRRDRILSEQARLSKIRDDLDMRSLNTGIADASASYVDSKLQQIPRLLEKAEIAIATARGALLQHDLVVAERAAERGAALRAEQANASKEEKAAAAAQALYDQLMNEKD